MGFLCGPFKAPGGEGRVIADELYPCLEPQCRKAEIERRLFGDIKQSPADALALRGWQNREFSDL